MKRLRSCLLFHVSFLVCLLFINSSHGDISDDECGIYVAQSVKEPSGPPVALENFHRKKIIQKSLLIVFDGTGSMGDDLGQMVPAAKEIIESFSSRKENPIKNYVLVVFQDPSKKFDKL